MNKPDEEAFAIRAVGESHYQAQLEAIAGPKTEDGYDLEVEAVLACEDQNPYDPLAVCVSVNGTVVGYLSRFDSRLYRQKFGSDSVQCLARIVGGWDRDDSEGHFGVRLEIDFEQ